MSELSKNEFQNIIQTWTLRIEGEFDGAEIEEEVRLNATYQFPEELIEEILNSAGDLSEVSQFIDGFQAEQLTDATEIEDRTIVAPQDPAFAYGGYRLDKVAVGVWGSSQRHSVILKKIAIKIPPFRRCPAAFCGRGHCLSKSTHPNIISVHELVRTRQRGNGDAAG